MEENITEGVPLSPDDEFWMDRLRKMTGESIRSVEDAAKQLVAMITVMQGIYAAVLAFSGIREVPRGSTLAVIAYASPIALWLVGLFFALRVFMARKYRYYGNSPDSSKKTFQQIADFKYKNLKAAYLFICLSFLVAIICIGYWLYTGSTPAAGLP